MVEEAAAGEQRHRPLAGVDQIGVLLPGGGRGAHPEHPVLAVQEDLAVDGEMVADQGGQADAQVHIGAVGDVPRHPGRELVARQALHTALPRTGRTRWTKMPGVTIASASSAPTSTSSSTSAMVQDAAVAMIGPKLRAVLR